MIVPDTGFLEIQKTKLSEILNLSESMLESAKRSEWPELTQTEEHRRKLIEDFFSREVTPETALMVEEVIKKIMVLDKEIIELGEAMKKKMSLELKNISTGRVAAKAYSENSR